jgi:hypothetical protein
LREGESATFPLFRLMRVWRAASGGILCHTSRAPAANGRGFFDGRRSNKTL